MSDLTLRQRIERLGLRGVAARWEDFEKSGILQKLVDVEERDRGDRGLQRRLRNDKTGSFRPIQQIRLELAKEHRKLAVEQVFTLNFLEEGANVILVRPEEAS